MVELYRNRREELIDEAMRLWVKHGFEYRTLLSNYNYLLGIKRGLGIKPLSAIKKSALDEYPSIPFLDLCDQSKAIKYLNMLDNGSICVIVNNIRRFIDSPITVTLRSRVCDYKYEIRHYTERSNPMAYAINPDKCTSGRHTHQKKISLE